MKPVFRTTGFTITEVLVSLSIAALVLVFLDRALLDNYKLISIVMSDAATDVRIQRVRTTLADDVRAMARSDRGDFPIAFATQHELSFYADSDDTPGRERVQYRRDGDAIRRSITASTGIPPIYAVSESTSTVIGSYANTLPLFAYFDGSNRDLGNTPDPALIRRIDIMNSASVAISPTWFLR